MWNDELPLFVDATGLKVQPLGKKRNWYLYTGVMPLPRKGTGVIPIFYFILASHDEKSFELCLHKFYNDARKIRDQTPGYKNQRISPYQCITDMSLVIFRPCLGKRKMKKRNNFTSQKKCFLTVSGFFSFQFSSYQIC